MATEDNCGIHGCAEPAIAECYQCQKPLCLGHIWTVSYFKQDEYDEKSYGDCCIQLARAIYDGHTAVRQYVTILKRSIPKRGSRYTRKQHLTEERICMDNYCIRPAQTRCRNCASIRCAKHTWDVVFVAPGAKEVEIPHCKYCVYQVKAQYQRRFKGVVKTKVHRRFDPLYPQGTLVNNFINRVLGKVDEVKMMVLIWIAFRL